MDLNYQVKQGELKHLEAINKIGIKSANTLGMVLKVELKDHLSQGHILVAEGDARVYGFLEYGVTKQGHWSLYKTAVALPARNQGIGSALTQEFIKKATDAGVKTRLKVTEDNKIAITFYQKNGYRIVDFEQSKVRKIFIMERQLWN